jgi:hypothetical protein
MWGEIKKTPRDYSQYTSPDNVVWDVENTSQVDIIR